MITRSDLLRSPEYWFDDAQNELYRQVSEYMEEEGLNQTQLAEKLQVTKGYVSQILKGQFNYTLKKLIELSLAIGKVPRIEYKSITDVLMNDRRVSFYSFKGTVSTLAFQASKTSSTPTELNLDKYQAITNKAA